MQKRKAVLVGVGVMLLAAAALMAQGPFQGGFQPDQNNGPFAQFMAQNPGLAAQFQGQFGHGGNGPAMFGGGQRGGIGKGLAGFLLAEYIGFTDTQKAVLEEARTEVRAEMRESVKALRQNQKKIREAARNGESVALLAQAQGDLIAKMIVQGAEKRADVELRLALTDEQVAKIETLRQHFEDRMGARREGLQDRFGGLSPEQP